MREPILEEHEKTHGQFKVGAEYFRAFCRIGKNDLNAAQEMALVMIHAKISRIMAGNPNEKDHWTDIAGYAKLGEEACE